MKCPHCKNPEVVKRGKRGNKFIPKQVYQCKHCKQQFTDSRLAHKTYPARVIVAAIKEYNLGYSLEESARRVSRRFKRASVSKNTVGNWARETAGICTYRKIRNKFKKSHGHNLIGGRTFTHGDNKYQFKYHRAKLDHLCSEGFESLAEYIKRFEKEGCPDFFEKIPDRCSKTKVRVRVEKKNYRNNACRLAETALTVKHTGRQQHPLVQDFMLICDSSTVAIEVPVWVYERKLDKRLSGHIDLVQVRRDQIYVLDFKPNAGKENEDKVISQLYWYATGLSFRTKIPLGLFRCAWFDWDGYFEFKPSRVKF